METALVLLLVLSLPLLVLSYFLLRWLLTEMAKNDIFVTFRTEGEIKAIMRGEDCDRYVVKVENHLIDPDDFDIFKASLESLTPLVEHFWAEAERRRAEGVEFVEDKKLLLIQQNPGEDENSFRRRIRQEFDQEPIKPKKKKKERQDGKVVEKVKRSPDWYVLRPDFHRCLVKANSLTTLERWFGVVWVGLPPFKVFSYKFRWIKYAQREAEANQPSGNIAMTPRDEWVNSLYFRYPVYGLVIDDAETGAGSLGRAAAEGVAGEPLERIQLIVELVFETITKNPQKTLFRTAGLSSAGEWLSAISREVRNQVRPWIGEVTYDVLISQKKQVQKKLDSIRDKVNGGLVGAVSNYGQEIVGIALVNVGLKDPALQESIDAIFRAKRELERAEFEANRDERQARGRRALAAAPELGRADGYAAIAAIPDGQGTRMRTASAIGEGNLRVVTVGGGSSANLINLPESLVGDEPPPTT